MVGVNIIVITTLLLGICEIMTKQPYQDSIHNAADDESENRFLLIKEQEESAVLTSYTLYTTC
jgi:hypothetical protein